MKPIQASSGCAYSSADLGLAIVKHVVDAHGRLVELVNRPGKGATFVVSLPIATPSEQGRRHVETDVVLKAAGR